MRACVVFLHFHSMYSMLDVSTANNITDRPGERVSDRMVRGSLVHTQEIFFVQCTVVVTVSFVSPFVYQFEHSIYYFVLLNFILFLFYRSLVYGLAIRRLFFRYIYCRCCSIDCFYRYSMVVLYFNNNAPTCVSHTHTHTR